MSNDGPQAQSMLINYHFIDCKYRFDHYDKRRSFFQDFYARCLAGEPRISGRLLDIGCGHGTNPTISKIEHLVGEVDGVDPFPAVAPHPLIGRRWTCAMEDLPVEPNTYDMAYSYNVVEHVLNEEAFLAKALEVLKPGGVYWSMSPNARHPFTMIVRLLQSLGLKYVYRRSIAPQANDYPAYYRLCNAKKVLRAIQKLDLPVARIDFYHLPNVQWDSFFPRRLRFLAHFIDRAIVLNVPSMSNIFMFRIEKSADRQAADQSGRHRIASEPIEYQVDETLI